jgi:hypothetical protein
VEASVYETEAKDMVEEDGWSSDLFIPLLLDTGGKDADGVEVRKFYLASVDAFKAPLAVVPDIGGPPNRYFQVPSRSKWSNEFVDWLQAPHRDDEADVSESEGDE